MIMSIEAFINNNNLVMITICASTLTDGLVSVTLSRDNSMYASDTLELLCNNTVNSPDVTYVWSKRGAVHLSLHNITDGVNNYTEES